MIKVLIVGNYKPDQKESLRRFASMLLEGLAGFDCDAWSISPKVVAHRPFAGDSIVSKWFGYIDKYMLFPEQLRAVSEWADVVHICDQSNSLYLPYLEGKPTVVTCHDLIAVRGALGEDTGCPASPPGKILQMRILSCLKDARLIACDSKSTLEDVERLTKRAGNTRLIHLGLNYPYRKIDQAESATLLAQYEQLQAPFVLHVGSAERRKNKDGVIRIFNRIKDSFAGMLVFAGSPLSELDLNLAHRLGLQDRILQVVDPPSEILLALYNRAHALLFPSRAEGFGWPVIEAQSCGCPVVCSDRGPLPEVSGQSALIHDFHDQAGFAESLLTLSTPAKRGNLVRKGLENARRFQPNQMLATYVQLYKEALSSRTSKEPGR